MDFKTKMLIQIKKGHFIIIKVSKYQEDTTIINKYAPNDRISKYIKQKLMKSKG